VNELHDDPGSAVVFGHVVDGNDPAMAEPGCRPGLAERPLVGVGSLVVVEGLADQDFLNGDIPVEQLVIRTPHHAHGPAADGFGKPVPTRDDPAAHWVHNRKIHGGG
jgi:hypothetical protein